MPADVTYKQAVEYVADLVGECMECMDTAEYLYPNDIEKQFHMYADSVEHTRKFYAEKTIATLFGVDKELVERDANAIYYRRKEMETAARAYVDELDRL